MRKLIFLLAIVAILAIGSQASAFGDIEDNSVHSTSSANSVGVGVGVGQGGDAEAKAVQGQQQGQVGINKQGQSQFGVNEQDQGQGQDQGQFGYVKTDVEVEGDKQVTKVDNDFPVNTAAPVFAGNCAQGVSAQTQAFGGSIASGNSVCDFIAVSGAFIAGGDRDEAFRVLGKAETAADWRFFFSRVRMVLTLGLL